MKKEQVFIDTSQWPNLQVKEVGTGGTMTFPGEIPKKLSHFEEFCGAIKQLILEGTDKYTGADKDNAETIDIMPQIFGQTGYRTFVLSDIVKRVIRYKNQQRDRDLLKIALWCYLLWKAEHKPSEVDNGKSTTGT